ncbi:MAG: hypothetical protein GX166_14510 [Clostridiaceae bacterium]|nr:hypothetical protein [Clostridiaceae bacterium]
MNIVRFNKCLLLLLGVIFFFQTVHANIKDYETIYEDDMAYAMENTYIKEEFRFDVPYALSQYNVTRTDDGGYLFLHVDGNRLSAVKYDSDGNLVFGDPLDSENYKPIVENEDTNVEALKSRYNLADMQEYNLVNHVVCFDDEYFYLPIVLTDDKYVISMVRFSMDDGTPDYTYQEELFEIEKDNCYSVGAVPAGEGIVVVNIDMYVYEEDVLVSLLHEIWLVGLDFEKKLVYSEEKRIEELEEGALVRKAAVSHMAVSYENDIYFVEGITLGEYNNDDEYEVECRVYRLGEDSVLASINELVEMDYTLENGDYYSVNLLPSSKGLGCIFNFFDVQSDVDSIYTYYSAIVLLSYEDMSVQFMAYYPESELIDVDGTEMLKYQNYLDLLEIDGELTIVWEYRKPTDDVIFLGELKGLSFVMLDDEGSVKDTLIMKEQLTNAETIYGSAGKNRLFVFDDIPEYDKYTQVLPPETIVSFLSLGYGVAYTVTGLSTVEVEVDEQADVTEGLVINNVKVNELSEEVYVEFEGQRLKSCMFSHQEEGNYVVTIVVVSDDGREFRFERAVTVIPSSVVNPPTGEPWLALSLVMAIILPLVLCKTERRKPA